MSEFKDMIAEDIDEVFFNEDEFAEEHSLDGKRMTLIIDENALIQRRSGGELGLECSSLVVYAKRKDLPRTLSEGTKVNLDGRIYHVNEYSEDAGVVTLMLGQNRTR